MMGRKKPMRRGGGVPKVSPAQLQMAQAMIARMSPAEKKRMMMQREMMLRKMGRR